LIGKKKIQLYLSNLPEQNEAYVRCIESWEDDNCYYLAMEYCGKGELFDFIRDNHTKGELSNIVKSAAVQEQKCQPKSNEWSECVQTMFRQMVDVVSWFHRNGTAHLDLSLENTMLASNDKVNPRIKIIDFGLAQRFTPDQKFNDKVGKVGYMAPEVYAKQYYSPEKADIWCLGVMLFMMLVGAPPYEFPSPTNPAYRFIIGGRLRDVLVHWRRLPLVTAEALDVMEKIFKPEKDRISMEELRQHKYVNLPLLTRSNAEPEKPAISASAKEKELKDRKPLTTGKDQTLAINTDSIPWVETKPAQEIVHQLRGTVGVENIRLVITNIEQSIDKVTKRIQSNAEDATKEGENPKAEGVTDEEHKYDSGTCVEELKKLLQVVKGALEVNTT